MQLLSHIRSPFFFKLLGACQKQLHLDCSCLRQRRLAVLQIPEVPARLFRLQGAHPIGADAVVRL